MSKEKHGPKELDDKDLEQVAGGGTGAGVRYVNPNLARQLNLQGSSDGLTLVPGQGGDDHRDDDPTIR